MKRSLRPDQEQRSPLLLKLLIAFLILIFIAQLYHKRDWFLNIPKQDPAPDTVVLQAPSPAPAPAQPAEKEPSTSSTLPEARDSVSIKKEGFFSRFFTGSKPAPKPVVDEIFLLDSPFDSLAKEFGLDKNDIHRKLKDPSKPYIEERLPLPKGKPLPEYAMCLTLIIKSVGLSIRDAVESVKDTSITLEVWGKEKLIRKVTLTYGPYYLPGYARLAFVLEGIGDDFSQEVTSLLSAIKRPMTLGLVPARPFTDKIYPLALQNGFEVLCQIPMENIPYRNLGEKAVYKHWNAKRIEKLLSEFSQSMPETKGYSIFGGGLRIVENEPEILKVVLTQIKTEEKYFIDNSFSSRSRVKEIASVTGTTLLEPLGYADTENDPIKQKEAILKFAGTVRKTGKGIILLKRSSVTEKALELAIPSVEELGIKIVTVSSLSK